MAVKYAYGGTSWAGGTATWKIGGPAGATTTNPTAADDVIFDSNSPASITVAGTSAVCRSMDFSGASSLGTGLSGSPWTGTLHLNASLNFTIGTSSFPANNVALLFSSTMTFTISTTGSSQFTFAGTGGGTQTIDTKGKTMPGLNSNVTTSGIFQLISGWAGNATGNATWNGGNLDFNGTTSTFTTFVAGTFGSISLNGTYSITCTASGFSFSVPAAANVSGSGHGTITCSAGNGSNFGGGGATYYNMVISSANAGISNITGTNTFNGNVTVTGAANVYAELIIQASQVINGTLTFTGNSTVNRLLIATNGGAGAFTLTCNGSVSMTNVDFYNVTALGTATWSGTSVGDCGLNSGITFTVGAGTSNGKGGVYRYMVAAGAATYAVTSSWSTTSGGTSGASIPLPQDTCIFDAHSGSGTRNLNLNIPRTGGIWWQSGIVGSLGIGFGATASVGTFSSPNSGAVSAVICGDFILPSAYSPTINGLAGGGSLFFTGSHSYTLTTQGHNFGTDLGGSLVAGYFNLGLGSSSYTLGSDLTVTSAQDPIGTGVHTTVNAVTFDTAGFNMTMGHFAISAGTLNMGNGSVWSVGGLNTTQVTTLNCQTSTVLDGITPANGQTFYALTGGTPSTLGDGGFTIIQPGPAVFTIHVTSINIYGITAARTLQISLYATVVVTGSFNVNGTSSFDVTIQSSSTGSAHTLSYTGAGTIQCDWLTIQDSNPVQTDTWFSGLDSTLVSNYGNWVIQVLGPTLTGTSGLNVFPTTFGTIAMTDSVAGLFVTGAVIEVGAVSQSATTTLTVAASVEEVASVALAGASGLTVAASVNQLASVSLLGDTQLNIDALVIELASVTMTDTSSELVAAAVTEIAAVATMTADSGLTADGFVTEVADTTLEADSGLTVIATVTEVASVLMSDSASGLTVAGSVTEVASVAMTDSAAGLVVAASVTEIASVVLSSTSALAPSALVIEVASVEMLDSSTAMVIAAVIEHAAVAPMVAHTSMVLAGTVTYIFTVPLTAQSSLVVASKVVEVASVLMTAESAWADIPRDIGEVHLTATSHLGVFPTTYAAVHFAAVAQMLAIPSHVTVIGGIHFTAVSSLVVAPREAGQIEMAAASLLVLSGTVQRFGTVAFHAVATMDTTGRLPAVITGELTMAAAAALIIPGQVLQIGAFHGLAVTSLVVAATVRMAGDTVFRARTALIVEAESGPPPRVLLQAGSNLVVKGDVDRIGGPSLEDALKGIAGTDPVLMGATGYMDNVFTTRLVGDSE